MQNTLSSTLLWACWNIKRVFAADFLEFLLQMSWVWCRILCLLWAWNHKWAMCVKPFWKPFDHTSYSSMWSKRLHISAYFIRFPNSINLGKCHRWLNLQKNTPRSNSRLDFSLHGIWIKLENFTTIRVTSPFEMLKANSGQEKFIQKFLSSFDMKCKQISCEKNKDSAGMSFTF